MESVLNLFNWRVEGVLQRLGGGILKRVKASFESPAIGERLVCPKKLAKPASEGHSRGGGEGQFLAFARLGESRRGQSSAKR
jgi:hypothetical protein